MPTIRRRLRTTLWRRHAPMRVSRPLFRTRSTHLRTSSSVADPENFKVAYAAIPARHAIELRQWTVAATLTQEHPDFPWSRFPWAQAITEFARGLGAARSGDIARAQASMARLQTLQESIERSGDRYWATQVEIQRLAVAAWSKHAQHDDDAALELMRQSADLEDASEKRPVTPGPIVPARELLGELLLELQQSTAALDAFETALDSSPNRLNGLLGAARAARAAGNAHAAQRYYGSLLAVAPHAQRPALDEARAYLRARDNAAGPEPRTWR